MIATLDHVPYAVGTGNYRMALMQTWPQEDIVMDLPPYTLNPTPRYLLIDVE